ncbi:PREDICTED: olfactory receptor 1019-like [Nanorana parkeri]|uniref:olfactory receptor 1019-like n=1 Tax=Nanorana parkeri TaxID=125878 RepID=UPI000854B3CA|nr:PREDICTED: olfactory receptor 1019-like [Nanorana parkeri]
MGVLNKTAATEFLLAGLTESPKLKCILFVFFFCIYILTLFQNAGLIVLISVDRKLYTPMYSFLCHLSFLDICYSSSITIRMLMDFVSHGRSISVAGCGLQMLSYTGFGVTECFLLAAMSYDRYVAICHPLSYLQIMSRQAVLILLVFSYVGGFLNAFVETGFSLFHLDFCEQRPYVHHFFCDVMALIEISCGDTRLNQMILFSFVSFIEFSSLMVILASYLCIIVSVLRISSSTGRKKAVSTCASHLTVVTLFYGTVMFMYLRPSTAYSPEQDKVIAVFYTIIIPFLNPLIYSLRNRDVKSSAKKLIVSLIK